MSHSGDRFRFYVDDEGQAWSALMQLGFFLPHDYDPDKPLTLEECRDEMDRFYEWKKGYDKRVAAEGKTDLPSEVTKAPAEAKTAEASAEVEAPAPTSPSAESNAPIPPIDYYQIMGNVREEAGEMRFYELTRLWRLYQTEVYGAIYYRVITPSIPIPQAPSNADHPQAGETSDLTNSLENTAIENKSDAIPDEKPVGKRAALIAKARATPTSLVSHSAPNKRAAHLKAKAKTKASQQKSIAIKAFTVKPESRLEQYRREKAEEKGKMKLAAAGFLPVQIYSLSAFQEDLVRRLPKEEFKNLPENFGGLNDKKKIAILVDAIEKHNKKGLAGRKGSMDREEEGEGEEDEHELGSGSELTELSERELARLEEELGAMREGEDDAAEGDEEEDEDNEFELRDQDISSELSELSDGTLARLEEETMAFFNDESIQEGRASRNQPKTPETGSETDSLLVGEDGDIQVLAEPVGVKGEHLQVAAA
ncbi:hypothetical protein K458DRAFT_384754 [Lentithecium fluviatile CBS 122367]|uniref:Uncharacterized protein n=1 Tax=Lentithecium fluviatile CBS 122367 TaxID=1168545 RepID=A0A6G1JDF6_9PLEO|nr:hypothetical protein K458DRAFT_384754 [Lentithecium fluviatile CBS 122367]